jgi:hypothetical protein
MAYPYKPAAGNVSVNSTIPDVSAPSSAWVAPGFNGRVRRLTTVLGGAITVADSNVTLKIGGTTVTNSALVVSQSGSAAGDVDQSFPSALNVFNATQAIEIVTDGGSTTTQPLFCTLELEPI